MELVTAGTFSAGTLSRHAISFQAGGYLDRVGSHWQAVLQRSMAAHKPTWLHHFHLGVIQLEGCLVPGDGNMTAAAASFEASLRLKETPEALRNLAIITHAENRHEQAFEHYHRALTLLAQERTREPVDAWDAHAASLLTRDIAAESSYQFALLGWTNITANLTADATLVPAEMRHTDRFRFAQVQAAYGAKDYSTMYELLDCAPTRLWPAIGWWGGGTLMLQAWFHQAKLAQAVAAKGQPLTDLETNAVYRANPVPFCIRAAGH